MHLTRYIHRNPAGLIRGKRTDLKPNELNKFLESYKWSSYRDYIGKRNFPSLINKDIVTAYFARPEDYRAFVEDYEDKDKTLIEDVIIERS